MVGSAAGFIVIQITLCFGNQLPSVLFLKISLLLLIFVFRTNFTTKISNVSKEKLLDNV